MSDADTSRPSESPAPRRGRCERHGLSLANDGMCVLCRRAEPAARSWSFLQVAIVCAVLLVAVAAIRRIDSAAPGASIAVAPAAGEGGAVQAPTVEPRTPLVVGDDAAASSKSRRRRMPQKIARHATPARARGGDGSIQVDADMHHVPITMYSTPWCPYCAQARSWLSSNGYRFSERDVEADESAKRERDRIAPGRGVPVFVVGNAVIGGFSEASLEKAIRRQAEQSLHR